MKRSLLIATILLAVLILPACSVSLEGVQSKAEQVKKDLSGIVSIEESKAPAAEDVDTKIQAAVPAATPGVPMVILPSDSAGVVAAYEGALTRIYEEVNPAVVNIRVLSTISGAGSTLPGGTIPGLPFDLQPFGDGTQQGQMPYSVGQGSGFIWDREGHIVTNNHVVDGATKVEVTFWDGTSVVAELVGVDPDSDLAVIKVDVPADQLEPVQLADSKEVKVGELAIAIGNPYGLNGSMTVGIVSAVGRTTAASESTSGSAGFSIPDVIQTDAPINPGNSGGVLVDNNGQVIGVTYMIESASGANAGIGFAIPSSIVSRVVPSLIQNGSFLHPYIGISGSTLTSDIREAMKLDPDIRGVLVGETTPDSPAEKAGLLGSQGTATVDGIETPIGGDIITALDSFPVTSMDELISLLASETSVGQNVTLTILREGKEMGVELKLEARPTTQTAATPELNPLPASTRPWIGITAGSLTPEIADAMGLPADQTGILIEQVGQGSPAEEAGLRGSNQAATIAGQPVMIGGDIIVDIGSQKVESMDDLVLVLENYQPGDKTELTILRDGKEMKIAITFGERPAAQ